MNLRGEGLPRVPCKIIFVAVAATLAGPPVQGKGPTGVFDEYDRTVRIVAPAPAQKKATAGLVFQDWDPYYNIFHIWTDGIAWSGYLVVGLTIVASLFVPRPFCRYACPLGAINGFFNSFSLLGIKRKHASCTDCGRCRTVCPVNIDPCAKDSVRSLECTRCMKCVEVCPEKAITVTW